MPRPSNRCVCAVCDTSDDILDLRWILACRCREDVGASLDWCWHTTEELTGIVKLSENSSVVTFHPLESFGTAVVRGTKPLSGGLHYWELKMISPLYGTDVVSYEVLVIEIGIFTLINIAVVFSG
ncbi:hypothetical protein P879_09197 [Paragonimus westermani]|uniref:B30.2/SPRY domain-containing protein n=1 Tax=Paragonimus westermani TaxID=34504 RepID=A0A8T0DK78_9TREM|nr:hypothetical protein P879_09197 [Paragonimus westermani]